MSVLNGPCDWCSDEVREALLLCLMDPAREVAPRHVNTPSDVNSVSMKASTYGTNTHMHMVANTCVLVCVSRRHRRWNLAESVMRHISSQHANRHITLTLHQSEFDEMWRQCWMFLPLFLLSSSPVFITFIFPPSPIPHPSHGWTVLGPVSSFSFLPSRTAALTLSVALGFMLLVLVTYWLSPSSSHHLPLLSKFSTNPLFLRQHLYRPDRWEGYIYSVSVSVSGTYEHTINIYFSGAQIFEIHTGLNTLEAVM